MAGTLIFHDLFDDVNSVKPQQCKYLMGIRVEYLCVCCVAISPLDLVVFRCDERVVRIQKMDVLEGIFICGAPCCLRSFFTRSEFESHVAEVHSQLLEQERISSVKTISMAISVSQAQVSNCFL